MKRVFLFVIVFLSIGAVSFAQKMKVSGQITDQNNEALVGVNVNVEQSYIGTPTNSEGKYSLKLKPGDYTLVFSYIGYEKKKIDVSLKKEDISINVTMKPSAMVTEDVIVQSTRASEKTPTSHRTMDKDEIEERHMVQDIPYMISLNPSVVATSESGSGVGYTSFRIRGTDPTRVNITIDGVPYNDSESQGTFWVNMPDFAKLTTAYDRVKNLIADNKILSARAVTRGGLAEAVSKMSFGNKIGFEFAVEMSESELFGPQYGALVLEVKNNQKLDKPYRELVSSILTQAHKDKQNYQKNNLK